MIYIDCCIYFKTHFFKKHFWFVFGGAKCRHIIPFSKRRECLTWMGESCRYLEYFFFFNAFCQSVSSHQCTTGFHICEVASFLAAVLQVYIYLKQSLFDLCHLFFVSFKVMWKSYQQQERMTQVRERLWRFILDHSLSFFSFLLLSVQGFELFEVELHRELASLHVRVRRGKNRAVFRQGCVQGQNISSPPSPNLSTASDPYHCVCVRACVCVSFTLGVCRVLYSYGYVVMLCIMAWGTIQWFLSAIKFAH